MNFEWAVSLDGNNYKVEFFQSPLSGKRTILVNGEVVVSSQTFLHLISAKSWSHYFNINDHFCMFTMQSQGLRWNCNLVVDEEIIEPRVANPFPLRTFLIRLLAGELFLIIVLTFLFYGLPTLIRGPGWIQYSALEMAALIVGFATAVIMVILVAGVLMTVTYRPTGNEFIRGAVLLMAAWIFISSMLFWVEANNKVIGMVDAIRYGLPVLWILVPILSAITLVALSLNPPGVATLIVPLIWITSGISIFTMNPAALSRIPSLAEGLGWRSLPIVGTINFFMSLTFAQGAKLPPLTSWFAKFQYFGAYFNYIGLYQFAAKYRLEVSGPSLETGGDIYVRGMWNGREIYLGTDRDGFTVSLAAHKILWPFEITAGINFPEVEDEQSQQEKDENKDDGIVFKLLIETLEDAKGKEFPLLLWHPKPAQINEMGMDIFVEIVERGKRFFTSGTRVWSSGYHVNFRRLRVFRVNIGYSELIKLIHLIDDATEYMEDNGFYIPEEELQAGSNTHR